MPRNRKTGTGAPPLSDDLELWSRVTATVRPLRKSDGERPAPPTPVTGKAKRPRAAKGEVPSSTDARPAPVRKPADEPPHARGAPPLTGLDRRTRQKFARGNAEIDGRIDLHGLARDAARMSLKNFLISARAAGKRTVLVITGKGQSPYSSHTLHGYEHVNTPERQGVIRRAFPQWLDDPEFRVHVAGYQPAHPRHGGGGAFYIRLRKQKG